ncbi:MAG: hypothetical protein ACI86C_001608 [Candidatus Latescibacterota bacterium]|jgi:hypothetical protein
MKIYTMFLLLSALTLVSVSGFVQENIEERVLGYFEVETLDTKRFFFNYSDFYPNKNPPPFFIPCEAFEFPFVERDDPVCFTGYLKIRDREILYFPEIEGPSGGVFPSYLYVDRLCGDCTAVGTPIIPEFWIE